MYARGQIICEPWHRVHTRSQFCLFYPVRFQCSASRKIYGASAEAIREFQLSAALRRPKRRNDVPTTPDVQGLPRGEQSGPLMRVTNRDLGFPAPIHLGDKRGFTVRCEEGQPNLRRASRPAAHRLDDGAGAATSRLPNHEPLDLDLPSTQRLWLLDLTPPQVLSLHGSQ